MSTPSRAGHTALIKGIEMYYETHGNGEPLVLLHGFTTPHSTGRWRRARLQSRRWGAARCPDKQFGAVGSPSHLVEDWESACVQGRMSSQRS
jgi:pimeloyl-ACP methyl ester carboxylesterase